MSTLSSEPEASHRPSGEKATLGTKDRWPTSERTSSPEEASHNLTASSLEPEASHRPSGEKATLRTESRWPSSERTSLPEEASHNLTALSAEPEASHRPSGEKATELNASTRWAAARRKWKSSGERAGGLCFFSSIG